MPQQHKRYISIRNVLIITLFFNWGVSFAKLAYGFLTKSISMTADGFHSLSDGASNVICLIGIFIASQPKDAEHPYGHKKYETLTSLGIAALLFFISINILKEVIARFMKPVTPDITALSFCIMLVTIVINILVVIYEYKKGKAFNSDILITDSIHTRTDIYASLSVVAALAAVKIGFPAIDLAAGFFIAVLIAISGVQIVRESSYVLCDGSAIDSHKVAELVKNIKGVKRCHNIRTRGRADDVHIDLHVSVDNNMRVDKAHGLSHHIQDEVKRQIPGVTDVIVHIEPT